MAPASAPGRARALTTSTFTMAPLRALFSSCAARPASDCSANDQSPARVSSPWERPAPGSSEAECVLRRCSVAQVRIVRRRLDRRLAVLRHTAVQLGRLHELPHSVLRAADRELGEEELELRLVRGGELRLRVRVEVPRAALERPDRLLPRLVVELFRR